MRATDLSVKPTALLVGGRLVGSAATIAMPIVLARVFGPHEFGTYKQLFLIYTTLLVIAPMGMAESLYYFIPRAPRTAGGHVANSFLVLTLTGLAALGLLAAGGRPLAEWFNNPDLVPHIVLLGLFLGLTVASSFLEIVMISRGRYLSAACAHGGFDLLRAAAFILPALWFRRLDAVLMGAIAFALFRLLAALAWSLAEFGSDFRPRVRPLLEQLSYTIPFSGAALLDIVQSNFHQYAVAHRFDAATFALFSVGCLQVPVVDLVAGSAGNVLMVRMGEAPGKVETARALWLDTTSQLAFVLFPLVALLLVTGPDLIVLLYTNSYAASAPIFRISCLSILFMALQTDAVLRAHAQTRFLLVMNGIRLALIAGLIGPCLSAFHLLGGAVATVGATAVAKGIALVRVRRVMGTGVGELLPWRRLAQTALASIAACLPALALRSTMEAGSLGLLVATGLTYLVSYLTAHWLVPGGEWGPGGRLAWLRSGVADEARRAA
jgi:O-antigen/teichoic acid export membrane protein